jgi:acetylserotonin N-methyltransferase
MILQRDNGIFRLTDLAREHLVRIHLGLSDLITRPEDRPVCKDFRRIAHRTGELGQLQNERTGRAMEDETFASQFTAAMDCRGVYLGQAVAKP